MKGGAEPGLRLGVGKQEQDDFYTAADNVQRRRLEVEIQADEDESRTAKREVRTQHAISVFASLLLSPKTREGVLGNPVHGTCAHEGTGSP